MNVRGLFLVVGTFVSVGCTSVDSAEPVTSEGDVVVSSYDYKKDVDEIISDLTQSDRVMRSTQIYFDSDSSQVPPKYMELIREVKMALAHNPDLKVYIQGHADEQGSQKYNIELSKKRAASILEIMQLDESTKKRISVDFFGEDEPKCKVLSSEGLSCNRRVDIFVVM